MKEPVWIGKDLTRALHEELLVEFGGSAGIRDGGFLESALGKPTLFDLAASYAFGIVRNHPFIDGNKRIGFMVAYTFLMRNGLTFTASEADVAVAVLSVAAGEMKEREFSAWLVKNSTKSPRSRR